MILRKPYAFLIKNFKKIHIILVAIMIYIAFSSTNIFTFFRDYVLKGSYSHVGSLSSSYVNNYMYIGSLFIVVISLIIYILMRLKKKPTLLYLVIIILYIGLLFYFNETARNLDILEIADLNPQTTRILRDVSLILNIVQYILIAMIGIRAIGFDIKRFNFGKDIEELQIEASDNEEFELAVGVDASSIGRKIRRQRRELKYFFIENLFVILLIFTIVIFSVSITLFLNFEVYNKVYNEEQSFKSNGITMVVNDSYYTHNNYLNNPIAPKDKAYVVVNISITNNSNVDRKFALNSFNLVVRDKIYSPMTERYQSFFDLGIGYIDQRISSRKKASYILVFEVPDEYVNSRKIFRFTESITSNSSILKAKYKKVLLKSIFLDQKEIMGATKFGEKLWLGESAIKSGALTINKMEMANKFSYKINKCINKVCNMIDNIATANSYADIPKTLIKLDTIYTFDSSILYMNVSYAQDLVVKFGKIAYKLNNKDYETYLISRTIEGYNGSAVIVEVPARIENTTYIELILNIRNKEYRYILKS